MRRILLLVLASLIAAAAPAPTPVQAVGLDLDHHDVIVLSGNPAPEEPGGVRVPDYAGADWRELGLLPGDIVRAKNGLAVSDAVLLGRGINYLDVVRGGKPLVIRVMIHDTHPTPVTIDDWEYDDLVSATFSPFATRVVRDGRLSGVRIAELAIRIPFEAGDVVRSIGGVAIHDEDALGQALRDLAVGDTRAEVDRDDRRVVVTLKRLPPLDLGTIHPIAAHELAVPRAIADAIVRSPQRLLRGVQATEVIDGGVWRGIKLFGIQPTSLVAALGLQEEDIVVDVEGEILDTSAHVYQLVQLLHDEHHVEVHVDRKGKRLALTYVVER